MSLQRVNPNQYADEANPYSTSGPGGGTGYRLVFNANYLRIANDKAVPVYVTLGSTTPSTGGFRTCSGEALEIRGFGFSAFSVGASGTTTGLQVRVLALGG